MSWNYRVLAKQDKEGEIYLNVHEVYHDKNGKPNGATENPITISGESIEDMHWQLEKIALGLRKTILWGDDRFPQEYKPE